jgi:predicted TPR repeat methyltransferase
MIAEKQYEDGCSADACMSQFNDYMYRGTEQITHMIEDRPGRSVLVATLAGFGVGLILSRLMTTEEAPVHSAFDRSTAERFGRQLLERVEQAMPAMLREKLGR